MLSRTVRTLFGLYAALAFALVILPLCLLIILGPTLKLRRAVGRGGVKLATLLMASPMRVRGLEHLPPGACICVSNHASYLDGLVLTAALPAHFTFLVQHGAAEWPVVGRTISRMGVAFVNRGSAREAAAATRELIRRIDEGESLTIFAEGTFAKGPGLLAFHNGAFMMATRAGVPVVPAVIRGSRQVFGEGMKLPGRARIEIEFLPPITAPGAGREAVAQLRDQTRAAILARCGEPDAQHFKKLHAAES